MTADPSMTPSEMADALEADAAALEDFASYVEANRDDRIARAALEPRT